MRRLYIRRLSNAPYQTHIYTELGTYSVALQVYNADGFSSMIREACINVTDTETYWLYLLPLALRNTLLPTGLPPRRLPLGEDHPTDRDTILLCAHCKGPISSGTTIFQMPM